jgi:hypothetical protein
VHALVREAPETVGEHALVVGANGPDQDRGSVWKAFDHGYKCRFDDYRTV